jgi:hypothetical protein
MAGDLHSIVLGGRVGEPVICESEGLGALAGKGKGGFTFDGAYAKGLEGGTPISESGLTESEGVFACVFMGLLEE